MDALITVTAQYLLFVLVAIAAGVWLVQNRNVKVRLAAEAVMGLIVVGIGIWLAGHLHTDPRPFVHDPHSAPLFPHPADNGFPSDHSAAGGLLAVLVVRYQRTLGAVVGMGAVAIAWARVAAHVHHGQDVVAGLAIGAVAGALAVVAVRLLARVLERRGRLPFRASGMPADPTARR